MKTLETNSNRSYLFDNMKAVLIFFVLAAHFIKVSGNFQVSSIGGVFYLISFSFIMQGFFFVSGYFSKHTEKCRKGAVKSFLVPYFVLMLILHTTRLILRGYSSFNFLIPAFGMWFLLAMFAYRFLIRDLSKIPGLLYWSAGLYLLAGCLPFLGRELALGRIVSFLFFFVLGYCFDQKMVERLRSIPKGFIWGVLGLLTAATAVLAYTRIIPLSMWYLKWSYAHSGVSNLEGIAARIVLAVLSLGWIFVILCLTPEKETFYSQVGKMTLTIYVGHMPIRHFIHYWGFPVDDILLTCLLSFALTLAAMYVLSRPIVFRAYNRVMDTVYDAILFLLRPVQTRFCKNLCKNAE